MTPLLTAGIGLKPEHFEPALACRSPGLWFEVHPENYMVEGGPRLAWLEAMRAEHPLSVHSVSLSLGSCAPPDEARIQALARFVRRFQPALVSEHLAWSRWAGAYLPDLLPLPRTSETLHVVCNHIDSVQRSLGVPIAIENPSHYLHLEGHEWSETGFLRELVRRTGCRLLLDVNNVAVSAHNLGLDAVAYLDDFPLDAVAEIHLAGHSADPLLGEGLWIDSHDAPVAEPVWALYERVIARGGARPTLIERDGNLPAFEQLLLERQRAHEAMRAAEWALA